MKKILALVLALALVMSLALPAMAANAYSLTINNTAPGHIYDAYQIFAGDLNESGTVLSNIKWGVAIAYDADNDGDYDGEDEYDESAALIAALTSDTEPIVQSATVTTNLATVLKNVTDLNSLVDAMGALAKENSPILDRMAQVIGAYANGAHIYLHGPTNTSGTQVDGSKYVIPNLPAGYYLIKDRDGSVPGDNDGDFYTKYLINIVKTHDINVKGEGVTVEKKINDTIDSSYVESEDFDINDTAYYKWEGTLPDNLLAYDKYEYTFVDTLPYGIEYTRIEAIYVEDDDDNIVHTFYTAAEGTTAANEASKLPAGMILTVEDIMPEEGENKVQHKVTLKIEDLLTSWNLIKPDHSIVVKYSSLVTRNALMKTAMTNEVYVNYSNNPNGDGIGKTVEDHAHAFTFDLVIDKYDMQTSEKLRDAEFVLYYTRIENDEEVPYYAMVVTEEVIYQVDENGALKVDEKGNYILRLPNTEENANLPAGEKQILMNGHPLIPDYLGNIYNWTTDPASASKLDTDENGYLKVEGLDQGTYYLEETKAPDGYNKLNARIVVDIIAHYGCQGTGSASECTTGGMTYEYKVDTVFQGTSNVVKVPNAQGEVLPTTGGMGTTLFYIFGGLMVAAAVVLLITKKRMANET